MPVRVNLAKKKARELLVMGNVTSPPVPVERLAQVFGATIRYEPFDGGISGMVLRRDGDAIIGINLNHPEGRRRFSIAHEIGHLALHEKATFHLDEQDPIRFRDSTSSTGENAWEVEANRFAAELLMPEDFLKRDVQQYFGLEVEDAIRALAKKYMVSEQAMTIRLTSLNYL